VVNFNSKARGVLERVEDDDTRDHQKAANLVMRSEICDERKFHKWSSLMENAVDLVNNLKNSELGT